mmetsp:Transcript_3166/g.14249  ORF Transcript_3166/g.14249 Transcript_3166/m.14249 type:complete len:250 (+) Transcript_3166:598-1347(+)
MPSTSTRDVLPAPRRPPFALLVLVVAHALREPKGSAHVERLDVHPLRRAPLGSLDHRAPAVKAQLVDLLVHVERPEEESVALSGLDGDPPLRAFTPVRVPFVRLIHAPRENRLSAFLHVAEVHQHGRHALTAPALLGVKLVAECVEVRFVLLPNLVPKHLDTLAVFPRNPGPLRDPSFDVFDYFILVPVEEHAVGGSDVARHGLACLVVHNGGLLQLGLGALLDVVALRLPQESAVEVRPGLRGELDDA